MYHPVDDSFEKFASFGALEDKLALHAFQDTDFTRELSQETADSSKFLVLVIDSKMLLR